MQTQSLPLDETACFSTFFLDYIHKEKNLAPFYTAYPAKENFKSAIEKRNFSDANRQVLVEVLKGQYHGLRHSAKVADNIEALGNGKTFTVTTGHQLNIFTGPLYFIYKIITVINACKSLRQTYPQYHFVPVYWMASEDHDFEEINHFYFEGKKYSWETKQHGAVGRLDPSDLKDLVDKLPEAAEFFQTAYGEPTLAGAVRNYVNQLFESEGVVVLDADEPRLKRLFGSVMTDDLFSHSSESLVAQTSAMLESQGYQTQVHARKVNLFYLGKDIRERIERTDSGFQILNTDLTFSNEEMQSMIQSNPERFSPNVILRPLYQETILPNLAYIGGPSETIYWLQLKAVFDHFKVAFPLLMPRNFALVLPRSVQKKWAKTNLEIRDLFLSVDEGIKKWVLLNAGHSLSYEEELNRLQEIVEELQAKSKEIDPTLAQHVAALYTTFEKKIRKAEKKLVRAEKRKHTDRTRQIRAVKETLFPGGSLQERRDNFLNFYAKDAQFIQKLLDTFDAFHYEMYLIPE